MKLSLTPLVLAASILALGALGTAQIKALTLDEMVTQTEGCVFGSVTGQEVFVIDHPVDGPELYYTTLTVQGRSLYTGKDTTIQVTYPGGFIDEEHGVYNSEAPSADEVKNGKQVVVFHKWTDNMGGDVAAHALYGMHGGLFSTFEISGKRVVQGRGKGYAVDKNIEVGALETAIATIRKRNRRGSDK